MHDCTHVLMNFMQSMPSVVRLPQLRLKSDLPLMGCAHSEDCICTLLNEMCPRIEVLTQTCLQAFLVNPTGTEILCMGFLQLGDRILL